MLKLFQTDNLNLIMKFLLLTMASYAATGTLLPIGTSYFDPRATIDYWMFAPSVAMLGAVLLRRQSWNVTLLLSLSSLLLAWSIYSLQLERIEQFEADHPVPEGYTYPTYVASQFEPGLSREQVHAKFKELGRATFGGYPPDFGPSYTGTYGESIYFQITPINYPVWFVLTYNSEHKLEQITWVD
jgi:hypothetical protein